MRLGQTHRAGPLTIDQARQVERFLLDRAMRQQAFVGAVGQARIHRPGLIGRVRHFLKRDTNCGGQTLAAKRRIAGQGRPAGGAILNPCIFKAIGRFDHAIALVPAALLIAAAIDREQHFGTKFTTFLEHLIDQFSVRLRLRGQLLQGLLDLQQFMQHKLHVAQRGIELRHRLVLLSHNNIQIERSCDF